MVNIEATSPQLQLVKDLLEAYCDFDMEKVGELLSKDYKFKTLPKHPDHPDQTKEEHLESYGRKLSLMVQLDVRPRRRKSGFKTNGFMTTTDPRPTLPKLLKHRGKLSRMFVHLQDHLFVLGHNT